jgi:hypothetical protein
MAGYYGTVINTMVGSNTEGYRDVVFDGPFHSNGSLFLCPQEESDIAMFSGPVTVHNSTEENEFSLLVDGTPDFTSGDNGRINNELYSRSTQTGNDYSFGIYKGDDIDSYSDIDKHLAVGDVYMSYRHSRPEITLDTYWQGYTHFDFDGSDNSDISTPQSRPTLNIYSYFSDDDDKIYDKIAYYGLNGDYIDTYSYNSNTETVIEVTGNVNIYGWGVRGKVTVRAIGGSIFITDDLVYKGYNQNPWDNGGLTEEKKVSETMRAVDESSVLALYADEDIVFSTNRFHPGGCDDGGWDDDCRDTYSAGPQLG